MWKMATSSVETSPKRRRLPGSVHPDHADADGDLSGDGIGDARRSVSAAAIKRLFASIHNASED